MRRRVGGVREFTFRPLSENRHLHITIAVTGWIAKEDKGCCSVLMKPIMWLLIFVVLQRAFCLHGEH